MGFVTEFDHPVAGRFRSVAQPIKMTGTPTPTPNPPPLLGQDTRDVLTELGYESSEIERMLDVGIAAEPGSSDRSSA
jgi:crotonobetainyl-CoA:carnitine CoA-transferase CaiB-like acyl-CoA transferase